MPEPMTACFAVPMATTASAQTRLVRPGGGVISLNALRSMITSAFMASAASWWRRSRRCACVRMGSSALAVSTSTTTRRLTRRTRLYLPVSSQPSSSSSSSSPSSASVRIDQNSVAGRSGNRKREQKQLRSSTWRPQLAPGGPQPTMSKGWTATQSDRGMPLTVLNPGLLEAVTCTAKIITAFPDLIWASVKQLRGGR